MVVICEECGKVYKLDPEKLKRSIKGKTSKIKCKICDHVIQISLPDETGENSSETLQQISVAPEQSPSFNPPEPDAIFNEDESERVSENSNVQLQDEEEQEEPTAATPVVADVSRKHKGLGLRIKMFFLFLMIPMGLMAASSIFTQLQMVDLAGNITHESTAVVKQLAEKSIIDKAKSVASQCSIFLKNNPDLNKDDFYHDFDMKRISIQVVGKKGYTALVEIPEADAGDEKFIIWCHPDKTFIGQPMLPTYKPALGQSYSQFKGFANSLRVGKGASGYYTWKDKTGLVRDCFVAIEPIEQTPYIIISSTFIEDFTGPIIKLEKDANQLTLRTRVITIAILVAILVLIFMFIAVYGYRLTNNIAKLTDAADRISVGELDVQINIKSNDEIGLLADAIVRMQDSLRFSIERLRRRR